MCLPSIRLSPYTLIAAGEQSLNNMVYSNCLILFSFPVSLHALTTLSLICVQCRSVTVCNPNELCEIGRTSLP